MATVTVETRPREANFAQKMMGARTIFAVLVSFALSVRANTCPIEREWNLDVSLKKAFSNWGIGAFKQAGVIAWVAEEDKRPLYVERCIAIIEREKAWVLVSLYRNPKEKNGGEWQPAIVYDAPQNPIAEFARKPTKKDLVAFLKSSWWRFKPAENFKVVKSGICEVTLRKFFDMTAEELKRLNKESEVTSTDGAPQTSAGVAPAGLMP